jgi:hypothetical protein
MTRRTNVSPRCYYYLLWSVPVSGIRGSALTFPEENTLRTVLEIQCSLYIVLSVSYKTGHVSIEINFHHHLGRTPNFWGIHINANLDKPWTLDIAFDPGHQVHIACDNKQTIGLMTKDHPQFTTNLKHVKIHKFLLRVDKLKNSPCVSNSEPLEPVMLHVPRFFLSSHNQIIFFKKNS